jgi:hypothetical protein
LLLDVWWPTNPQTWNSYAYVTNNPLSYIDPLGLQDSPCPSGCLPPPPPILPCYLLPLGCQGTGGGGGPSGRGNYCTEFIFDGTNGGNPGHCPSQGGRGAAPHKPTNNGTQRVPNQITCNTVLPDGSTVGSHINSVVNSVGNSANTENPVLEGQTGLNPISVMSQVFSGTNFRAMYGGPGANYAFLGDAGNFAYGAVSAQIGVPLWATEAVAGGYSLLAHPSSDWVGPYFMDPSATVQVPAGYNAQCKD